MTPADKPDFFSAHEVMRSGYEVLVYGVCFTGTDKLHYFNDHRHAQNFCRYLFSLTKAHSQNDITRFNVVCEPTEDGKGHARFVGNPKADFTDFSTRKLPKANAHKVMCDDGAYLGFFLLTPGKRLFSNMAVKAGDDVDIKGDLLSLLSNGQYDAQKIYDMFERSEEFVNFDAIKEPSDQVLSIDFLLQRIANRAMGGKPLLSISHRDQIDHNSTYHIHRLLPLF
jgi:hypothetical protein